MHDCVKKRHDRAKKDRACLVLSTVWAVYVPKKTEPVRYLEQFGRIRSKKDRGCLVCSSQMYEKTHNRLVCSTVWLQACKKNRLKWTKKRTTVSYVVQFGCKRVKEKANLCLKRPRRVL